MGNLAGKTSEQLLKEIDLLKTENAELKKNKDYFQIVVENAVDFIAITTFDLNAKYLYVSPSILKATGYKAEELLGKSSFDFIHPEDKNFLFILIKKYIKLKLKSVLRLGNSKITETLEFRFKNKAGEWSYLQNNFSFIGKNVLTVSRDITEQKQMNLALKESKNLLNATQQLTKVGGWKWNVKNQTMFWTDETYRIHEIDRDEIEKGSGKHIELGAKCYDEKDRKVILEAFQKCLDEGIPYDLELPFTTVKGNRIWIRTVAQAEQENGKVVGVTGNIIDITEGKLAEKELSNSYNLMQYIVEHSNSAIAVHDRDLNYIYVSQNYLDQYKVNDQNVIGKHHYEVFPDLPQKWRDVHQKALLGEISSAEDDSYEREDGTVDWTRWECRPWYEVNGEIGGIIVYTEVITERKRMEKELQQSEEKYRIFFENNDAIILFVNPDNGQIIFSNAAAAKYYGYSREQLTSMNINEINILSPDEIKAKMADARTRKQNYFLLKHRLKSGEIRDVEIYQSKLFLNNQDVFSIIVHDITERLKLETALKSALEKAEESDRLKSAFLANMSHEIRTPMNGILGFADLLKEPKLSSDVQKKYVGIIEKSGARMLGIINDLIDISKVESGQLELVISESNINEQIEYIYTFFKPEVERKGMQLFFYNQLKAKEAIVKTDREKIFAILTNLVKNAIKYSDKGSIELGYKKKHNYFEFYVKDTGIGIPKERQQAIFDRFIQADITDTHASQGAGLGLAISRAYVEMLGGKIWVESEKGVGSQFYFTIPCLSGKTKIETATITSDSNSLSKS